MARSARVPPPAGTAAVHALRGASNTIRASRALTARRGASIFMVRRPYPTHAPPTIIALHPGHGAAPRRIHGCERHDGRLPHWSDCPRRVTSRVPSHPQLALIIARDLRKRPADSFSRHLASPLFRAVPRGRASGGAKVERNPGRRPTRGANAVAERWVGTVRREGLDHLPLLGRQHLVRVLRSYEYELTT